MIRILSSVACLMIALPLISGCAPERLDAETIIARAVAAHGGDRYARSDISFEFRNDHFTIHRRDGIYRYERRMDSEDRRLAHILTNDSLYETVDGIWRPWPDERRKRSAESTVNSVVYFSLLPFPLQDAAVRARVLDTTSVLNEPYHVVEVTFREEGGGRDWEDRFVYWFHRDTYRMDYFAYRFFTDGGGTRFRQAVNPRTVNGIRLQDYLNFASPAVEDIAQYPVFFESGDVELISRIEIKNIEVEIADG